MRHVGVLGYKVNYYVWSEDYRDDSETTYAWYTGNNITFGKNYNCVKCGQVISTDGWSSGVDNKADERTFIWRIVQKDVWDESG